MADKEIRIPFDEIRDPQTITQRNIRAFKENDMSIHHNDVLSLTDDHSRKQRILKIKKVRFFDMGRGKK